MRFRDIPKCVRTQQPSGILGVTLIELLVAMTIAAILMAIAIPSFRGVSIDVKLRGYSNALLASLYLARSDAIKRNGRSVVCRSADGANCATSGDWEQGWIVFQDLDGNASRTSTEAIIERHPPLAAGFQMRGNTNVASYVAFHPSGSTLLASGAQQGGTIAVCCCASELYPNGKQIVISLIGRARICNTQPLTACPPSPISSDNCRD
jgi:type IV fimbrial biogenesis protein FimT